MARLPYRPLDDAGPESVVAPIRARRGGTLLHLDRLLLHSPPLAQGWNAMLGAVRSDLSLPARLRELAICGVAVLNGAPYEFHHHAPLLLREGASQDQIDALEDVADACTRTDLFDAAERAVLQLTLEMTRDVRVNEACFADLRAALADPRQIMEVVAVVATYNMVSRVIAALDIEPEHR